MLGGSDLIFLFQHLARLSPGGSSLGNFNCQKLNMTVKITCMYLLIYVMHVQHWDTDFSACVILTAQVTYIFVVCNSYKELYDHNDTIDFRDTVLQ